FLPANGFLLCSIDLMSEHNLGRAFRSHDGDLRGWPRHYPVSPEIFAAHGEVRATISLAQDDRNLRDGRRRVGKQHLGAVANDAAVLLLNSGQESWHVDKCQQRNIEGIAEADEA